MKNNIYITPEVTVEELSAASLLSVSGTATGEGFGNGTDFGGKDKWEGTRW